MSIEKVDTSSPTVQRRALHMMFGEPVSTEDSIANQGEVVNSATDAQDEVRLLPTAEEIEGAAVQSTTSEPVTTEDDVRHLPTAEEVEAGTTPQSAVQIVLPAEIEARKVTEKKTLCTWPSP